ncbi:hypothetical protein DVH24_013133 [Malus domestica]|uniref:Uncharacterized protein n=1 Tax=Malus domestica TaxID=3750 RepID=A0A498IJZ9_MALDO|nr:hypothetical protein DVH24_013133 [Malus domestica]
MESTVLLHVVIGGPTKTLITAAAQITFSNYFRFHMKKHVIFVTQTLIRHGLLHGSNEACHLKEIVLTKEPEPTNAQERTRACSYSKGKGCIYVKWD